MRSCRTTWSLAEWFGLDRLDADGLTATDERRAKVPAVDSCGSCRSGRNMSTIFRNAGAHLAGSQL